MGKKLEEIDILFSSAKGKEQAIDNIKRGIQKALDSDTDLVTRNYDKPLEKKHNLQYSPKIVIDFGHVEIYKLASGVAEKMRLLICESIGEEIEPKFRDLVYQVWAMCNDKPLFHVINPNDAISVPMNNDDAIIRTAVEIMKKEQHSTSND